MLNIYGDHCSVLSKNKGADIATQRMDELDAASVLYATEHVGGKALDFCCGAGGQAARLAKAGAHVIGLDMPSLENAYEEHMRDQYAGSPTWGSSHFVACDMLDLSQQWLLDSKDCFSQITCQRAIHYVPQEDAIRILKQLRDTVVEDGKLFISCSGLYSELGREYAAGAFPPAERFGYLSEEMQNKHQIKQPVCLYSQYEFIAMLASAGWRICTIYASPFGNIKAIASKE